MTDKEKIKMFMQEKANILASVGVDPKLYYKEEDSEIIDSWSDFVAERIWCCLEQNIMTYKACNLSQNTCPFCIYCAGFCSTCFYRKTHNGICSVESTNDFSKIIEIGKKKEIWFSNILSNDVYKSIIENINIKHKNYSNKIYCVEGKEYKEHTIEDYFGEEFVSSEIGVFMNENKEIVFSLFGKKVFSVNSLLLKHTLEYIFINKV